MPSPNKKKLFLNSTDVSQITGLSIRTARNMMKYIREERQLGQAQCVSIYDFCACFNLPVQVVFEYINCVRFDALPPLDDEALRASFQLRKLDNPPVGYLYHEDMGIFMNEKELQGPKEDLGTDDQSA